MIQQVYKGMLLKKFYRRSFLGQTEANPASDCLFFSEKMALFGIFLKKYI